MERKNDSVESGGFRSRTTNQQQHRHHWRCELVFEDLEAAEMAGPISPKPLGRGGLFSP